MGEFEKRGNTRRATGRDATVPVRTSGQNGRHILAKLVNGPLAIGWMLGMTAVGMPALAAASENLDEGTAIPPTESATASAGLPSLFRDKVDRSGFHFSFTFGVGGGPDSFGLSHTMEIGGTFDNGWTLALLHTFIQNKGIGPTPEGGPDLFGGWMPELKIPIFFPELEFKVGIGLGGVHDQSDGIRLIGGLGWAYGVDLHYPFFETSGMTLALTFIQVVVEGRHHFGASLGVGYTWF
jgi:hypothetical protein